MALTVKLFKGSPTGTEEAILSLEGSLTASTTDNYTFAPASTLALARSTTYWVVAEGGDTNVRFADTFGTEDPTSAEG